MSGNIPAYKKSAQHGQKCFIFGEIRLDKTLTLANAHHIKELECSQAGLSLVDSLLNDLAKEFKRFRWGLYSERLSVLLANLLFASSYGKGVIYSRNKNHDKVIISLVDHLAKIGLVDSIIQPPNESGCRSYVTAMPELTRLLNIHKARIAKGKKHQPIILRDENKKGLSVDRLKSRSPVKYRELLTPVELHNQWWNNNSATLDKKPVVPFLHRVFNKSLDLGGRFYGSYQSMSGNQRGRILFNGKPTVELDYSAIHIAIMYAWAGVSLLGDPYEIKGYERKTVKAIMLRLVNVESIGALKAVITNSAKVERQTVFKKYKQDRAYFESCAARNLIVEPPRKPKWIDSHIENIPSGFNAKDFLKCLYEKHSAISGLLGSADIGLRLQAADSNLMGAILTDLYTRKAPTPVLPVHDSLVCRKSNSELVRLTMKHHFKQIFNAECDVKDASKQKDQIVF